MNKFAEHLINGVWVESSNGRRAESTNPSTGEVLGHFADASLEDGARAIMAAKVCFLIPIGRISLGFDRRCYSRLRNVLNENGSELHFCYPARTVSQLERLCMRSVPQYLKRGTTLV